MNENNHIESLINQLNDPNLERAHMAQQELESMGDAAVDALAHAMHHAQGRRSWLAVCALSSIDSERTIEPLIEGLLDSEVVDSIRQVIAQALGKRHDPRIVEPLIRALGDSSYLVQISAIDALGNLGDKRAVESIVAVLTQTTSPTVRYTAIRSLAKLGDSRVVPVILRYQD